MNNSKLILISPFSLYTEKNFTPPIKEIDLRSLKILFSTLLVENFLTLLAQKKFSIDLIINEDDFEYLPAIFNTINTKIYTINEQSFNNILNEIIRKQFKDGYKKIVLLYGYTIGVQSEIIDFISNALPIDSEKLIIGTDNLYNLALFGINDQNIIPLDAFNSSNSNPEYFLKDLINQNAEILLLNEFKICKNLQDVLYAYKHFKKIGNRHNNIYINQFLSHFSEKYKGSLFS